MTGAICDKCGYNNDFSAIKCPCGNRLKYSDEEDFERMSITQKRVMKIIELLGYFWLSKYGFLQLIVLHVVFLWSILLYFHTVPLSIIVFEQIIFCIVVAACIKLFDEVSESFFYYVVAFFVGLTIFSLVIAFVYAWYQS